MSCIKTIKEVFIEDLLDIKEIDFEQAAVMCKRSDLGETDCVQIPNIDHHEIISSDGKRNFESCCKWAILNAFDTIMSKLSNQDATDKPVTNNAVDIISTLKLIVDSVQASSEDPTTDDMLVESVVGSSDDNNSVVVGSTEKTVDMHVADNDSSSDPKTDSASTSSDDNSVAPSDFYADMVQTCKDPSYFPPSHAKAKGMGSSSAGGSDIHVDKHTTLENFGQTRYSVR